MTDRRRAPNNIIYKLKEFIYIVNCILSAVTSFSIPLNKGLLCVPLSLILCVTGADVPTILSTLSLCLVGRHFSLRTLWIGNNGRLSYLDSISVGIVSLLLLSLSLSTARRFNATLFFCYYSLFFHFVVSSTVYSLVTHGNTHAARLPDLRNWSLMWEAHTFHATNYTRLFAPKSYWILLSIDIIYTGWFEGGFFSLTFLMLCPVFFLCIYDEEFK